VFQQVLEMINASAEVTDYIEPEIVRPGPAEAAIDEYNRLRGIVDFTIALLKDAVDLAQSTPKDANDLQAWKQFRVLLSRVPGQPGYPKSIQ